MNKKLKNIDKLQTLIITLKLINLSIKFVRDYDQEVLCNSMNNNLTSKLS